MVGGASSLVMDSSSSPCLCLDAHTTCYMRITPKKKVLGSSRNLELGSSFVDSSIVFKLSSKPISRILNSRRKKLFIVSEDFAGNYEDTFGDVKKQIVNYFTFKAVRTVLHQLYEMNPPKYKWFYNHLVSNKPADDGKRFLRSLAKENQELAERVMITRLHLYGKWIKKCDHGKIYQEISDENLALMRERLMETVIWPSDDSEVIG